MWRWSGDQKKIKTESEERDVAPTPGSRSRRSHNVRRTEDENSGDHRVMKRKVTEPQLRTTGLK